MKLKKLLFGLAAMAFATQALQAQTLPQPQILTQETGGWFDTFVITWWQSSTVPYTLEIVDKSGITVTKNKVEDLDFAVNLTNYQQTEYTPEYTDSRLVIILSELQFEAGASYDVFLPAGAVNVIVDGVKIPNSEINYNYVLKGTGGNTNKIPEANVSPAQGNVETLSTVTLSWRGFEVYRRPDGLGGNLADITLSINGGEPQVLNAICGGNPSKIFDGYFQNLQIEVNARQNGQYVITIPEDCLYIANENDGSLSFDQPLVLTYNVNSGEPAGGSVVNFVINGDASGLQITDEEGNAVAIANNKAEVVFDGSTTLTFSTPNSQSMFIWSEEELADDAMVNVEIPEEEEEEGKYMLRYTFNASIDGATVIIDVEGEGPGIDTGEGYALFVLNAPEGFDPNDFTMIYRAIDEVIEFVDNSATFTWPFLPATLLYKTPADYNVTVEIPSVLQENVNYQTGSMEYMREGENQVAETYNYITLLDLEDGLIFNFVVTKNGNSGIGHICSDNAEARYFSFDGREISNPQPGQLLIRVSGNKAEKIVF